MDTGDEFLHFGLKIGVHHRKGHIEISQLTKFEVLLLDCNHAEGFKKSEKLETLFGFGRRPLRIRHLYGIWPTFDRSQPGFDAMKYNQT